MNWPLLAQESDSSDLFRWAIILFFIVSSIISAIGSMIKKKRGQVDDDDIEEDDDSVIILSDEIRPAMPPPVARRARPPARTAAGETRPAVRTPVRPAAPPPPRQRPAGDRPAPLRRPMPAEKAKPRPTRRRVGGLVDHHAAIEHAQHIRKRADVIGDQAEEVGTLDDRFAKQSRSSRVPRKRFNVSRMGLRQAIVLNEILGPPLALRKSDDGPGPG